MSDGARLWDVETGSSLLELKGCADVHFNADATLVADSAGNVCEAKSGLLLHKADGKFVAFSPDGSALALWTYRGAAKRSYGEREPTALDVIDARDGRQLHVFGDLNGANAIAFSPDGRWLAFSVYGDDEKKSVARLEVWDARSWQLAYALKNYKLDAFSPDGRYFTAARRESEKDVVVALVGAQKGDALASLARRVVDAGVDRPARG